ncbi:MAG: hypothetical protein JWQ74_684 [Marmoricola sp.]|nr:hypothetical protein [Marmoricola sp.]
MHHRPSPLRVAGAVVSVALALVVAGCGSSDGPVEVRAYAVPTAGQAACASLVAALPATVADQPRRATKGSPYAAAWGDRAIVLRCGVGTPKEFDKFSACQRTNGVDWFVPDRIINDQRADVLMTTIGRTPAIEVLVPASYRPSTAAMVDLGATIKAHTKVTRPCV